MTVSTWVYECDRCGREHRDIYRRSTCPYCGDKEPQVVHKFKEPYFKD